MLSPPRTMTKWVVIQATPFCNVNCCYFSLSDSFSPKCDRRTLEYAFEFLFSNCGGVTASNKLCENNTFDSAETMRCKQALVDTALDYVESRYVLSPAHNGSLLERVERLRERMKREGIDELRLVSSKDGDEDGGDGDGEGGWNKRAS